VFLYAFDLLELNSEDYRALPLEKRKGKLERLLTRTAQGMRFSERNHFPPCLQNGIGRHSLKAAGFPIPFWSGEELD
jgi:hypothetical protein